MNRVVFASARALVTIGDAADAAAGALRRTPGSIRAALEHRGQRRTALATTAVVLVLYLLSIGDLAVSPSGRWAGTESVRYVPDALWRPRAPYLYEPIVQLHLGPHMAVFFSPINTLLGLVVAGLAGTSIALAVHSARHAVACRRPGYGRVLGVLPAFLLGFACCVPTFVLALGATTAAAVLPILMPLRSLFYPLTLAVLLIGLIWGSARLRQLTAAAPSAPSTSPRPTSAASGNVG